MSIYTSFTNGEKCDDNHLFAVTELIRMKFPLVVISIPIGSSNSNNYEQYAATNKKKITKLKEKHLIINS